MQYMVIERYKDKEAVYKVISVISSREMSEKMKK